MNHGSAKSEIRDGMQIDWDVPIRMDDGVVLRADVYRPVGDGKYPVILSYGPYAKGLSFQEGYKSQWARLTKAAPEVLQGSSNKYQNWELVDPEKWVPDGYACVRVDSRGAGRSPGYLDVWSAREAQDLYRMRRMGGHAGLEQRQGRHQRHFLLRDEPVERGRAEAAASRRAVHLGRLVRLLPRAVPARRNPVRLSQQLASAPGGERAAWRRRARRQERGDRRAGRRAARHCPKRNLPRTCADTPGEAKRRRLRDDYYAARTAEFEKIEAPLAVGRQLGRRGPAHARQFRRLAARRLQAEMAGGARRYPLHAFLQQLRRDAAEALLRPLPERRGHRLEQAAARVAQHPPPGRKIRAARRERMAARAHAMDQIFSAARRTWARPRRAHGRRRR